MSSNIKQQATLNTERNGLLAAGDNSSYEKRPVGNWSESAVDAMAVMGNDKTVRRHAAKLQLMLLAACCVMAVDFAAFPNAAFAIFMPMARPPLVQTFGTRPCPIAPSPDQVLIFTDRDGGDPDTCRVLTPGLYPDWHHLGINDNWMSSIWVGSGVRARLFKDSVYRGVPLTICGGTGTEKQCGGTVAGSMKVRVSLGVFNLADADFNDSVSSMRVERIGDAPTCNDLRDGEVALFTKPNLGVGGGVYLADCIVQPKFKFVFDGTTVQTLYNDLATPEDMGIADNALSSMNLSNIKGCTLRAYPEEVFGGNETDFSGGGKPNGGAGTSSITICR